MLMTNGKKVKIKSLKKEQLYMLNFVNKYIYRFRKTNGTRRKKNAMEFGKIKKSKKHLLFSTQMILFY